MGKDKYEITDEEFEAQKATLVEAFKRNVALIKEIIPDFKFSDDKIDKYITKERIILQKKVLDYNESVRENKIDFDSSMIPESYERSMFTFYDKSGTPEAKENNKKILDKIQAPTEEGDKLRKKFFIDSLNVFQDLDYSGISEEKSFEEKADFLIKNFDIVERGFEFQKINYAKKSSIGIAFSEEHENNIKTIERKAVDIGGKCRSIKSIIQSDLFLTFPFEDLTMEQAAILAGTIQSRVVRNGATPQEGAKYGAFINAVVCNFKVPDNENPIPHTYTMDDIKDVKYDVPELIDKLNGFYARLLDISANEKSVSGDLFKMINTLSDTIDQITSVKGAFTPEQAACFSKATSDLYVLSFQTMGSEPTGDPGSKESKLYNIKNEICEFLSPNITNKLLFESAVVRHNVKNGEEVNPEYISKLGNLVDKVLKCGLSYEQILDTADSIHVSPDTFVKMACEGKIKWQPKKWDIEKLRTQNDKKLNDDRVKEVMQKFNVPSDFHNIINASEITAEEIDEFPFIKALETPEEKSEAFAAFLKDGKKYSDGNVPEEYAKALNEENLSYGEIWSLSLKKGITVDEYMSRLIGTGEDQYESKIKEINDELKANAKNPIETLMAETMINLKELSFTPGNRIEMEKCMARFVALKAIQNHAGIKKGESLEDEPERLVALSKTLANLDKYTKDVFENDTFRYLAKTYGTEELSQLSRGTNMDGMYKFCDELKNLQKENSLHTDRITCMDKLIKYSDFAMRNENFFPDKFTLSDHLIKSYPNPFRITVGRTGLVTFAYAGLIERGFDVEDIMDPYKLTEVKKEVGREVFEMVQHEENREAVTKTFLTGYRKTIEYANKEFEKLNSLNPIDVVKLGNPTFLALGNIIKDYSQELGRMRQDVPFSEENENELIALDAEGEIIDKYIEATLQATNKLVSMNSEKDFNKQSVTYNNEFVKLAYFNKSFVKSKELAKSRGMTISASMRAESEEKPQDPSAPENVVKNAYVLSIDYGMNMPQPIKNAFETNKDVRNQIGKDVFSGKFSDDLKIKVNREGNHVISTDYYKQFENVKELV